jgi:hypothetical protein
VELNGIFSLRVAILRWETSAQEIYQSWLSLAAAQAATILAEEEAVVVS